MWPLGMYMTLDFKLCYSFCLSNVFCLIIYYFFSSFLFLYHPNFFNHRFIVRHWVDWKSDIDSPYFWLFSCVCVTNVCRITLIVTSTIMYMYTLMFADDNDTHITQTWTILPKVTYTKQQCQLGDRLTQMFYSQEDNE